MCCVKTNIGELVRDDKVRGSVHEWSFLKMVYMRKKKSLNRRKYAASKWAVGPTLQQRVRGPEVKTVDVSAAVVQVSTSTTAVLLNSLVVGAEVYQRLGRAISMKSIEIKNYIFPSGNTATNDALRFCVVYDRNPDGAYPTFSEVFTSINAAGSVTTDAFCFPNPTNVDRFKILKDWHIPIIPSAAVAPSALAQQDPNLPMWMHHYVNLGGLESRYGNGATHPTSGGLYLFIQGVVAPASAGCNCVYQARLRYTDQ